MDKNVELNKTEQSLLFYFHHCAVNRSWVEGIRMNKEDFDLIPKFEELGLCRFRRLKMAEIKSLGEVTPRGRGNSHKVMLTELGFDVANKYFKEKHKRYFDKYPFEYTEG